MRIFRYLFILVVMVIGAAFAVMNAEAVTLNYYFGSRQLPLSIILVGAMVVGALLGVLSSMAVLVRVKRDNASLRRQARIASQEVKNLRAIPIKDQ